MRSLLITLAGSLAQASLIGAAPAAAANVLTYHNEANRHGLYVDPGLTQQAAANLHLDPNFSTSLNGQIYAQPLYWERKGGPKLLIVATEANVVYGLNADTGAVVWQSQLPPPVPLSDLSCGNIDPEGIDGTPVIDPASETLFLNALTLSNGTPKHMLYALSPVNGYTMPNWPLDVAAALAGQGVSFTAKTQGERGALMFFQGALYVAYGGKDGDCDPYHGTVVQVQPNTAKLVANWQTRAERGGIWAQGGLVSDGKSLYVTTGNTEGATTWQDGEAIVRLAPGLAHSANTRDYFAPSNWQSLDQQDLDLGGTQALPLAVTDATGHAPRALALGKDGNAYLVNRANLGGIGGQIAVQKVSNTEIKTAPAILDTPGATLAAFTNNAGLSCSGTSITMLSITNSATNPISTAWCAAFNGGGAPIITTTDGHNQATVWVVGAEGDNQLHGFDAATGKTVFGGGGITLSGLHHFQTLISANHHLYVAADGRIYAFAY